MSEKLRSKKEQAEFLIALVREDGRPEVYDVDLFNGSGSGYICFVCDSRGHILRRHQPPNVYMASPVNSPGNVASFVCKEHLPENAVIYNPKTNKCRDKAGLNEWEETADAKH